MCGCVCVHMCIYMCVCVCVHMWVCVCCTYVCGHVSVCGVVGDVVLTNYICKVETGVSYWASVYRQPLHMILGVGHYSEWPNQDTLT